MACPVADPSDWAGLRNNIVTYNTGSIQSDLGEVKKISTINIAFGPSEWETPGAIDYPGSSPNVYTVEVSEDGSTWTNVATKNGVHAFDFSFTTEGINARYVRLSYTKINDGSGWCLVVKEFTVEAAPIVAPSATLIVKKHVINDNAGVKSASDFVLHVTGATTTDVTGSEDGVSLIINLTEPASYNVTEDVLTDYLTSSSTDCIGTIAVGETKTCTITNDDIAAPTGGEVVPPAVVATTTPGDSGSSRSTLNFVGGTVLGASTTTLSTTTATTTKPLPNNCALYLGKYLRRGDNNDPKEVKKLQKFLSLTGNSKLEITGNFNAETEQAVKDFQKKLGGLVLKPWVKYGLKNEQTATGYVYKTTRYWINQIACPSLSAGESLPSLP